VKTSTQEITMKIYSFPGSYNRNHEASTQHYERGSGALKRDRHAADTVEISAEARKRYEAARIIELDRKRTRKIAREYEPVVRSILSKEGDDITRARVERIAELQRAYSNENTVFSDDILRFIANLLL
jgi:hypothetical protein